MNWNEIREQYPKAWEVFWKWKPYLKLYEDNKLGWEYTDGVHQILMFASFVERDLYDFFDEQKIYIIVEYQENRAYPFSAKILEDGYQNSALLFGDSRSEAENKAFEKAFEILEGRVE